MEHSGRNIYTCLKLRKREKFIAKKRKKKRTFFTQFSQTKSLFETLWYWNKKKKKQMKNYIIANSKNIGDKINKKEKSIFIRCIY